MQWAIKIMPGRINLKQLINQLRQIFCSQILLSNTKLNHFLQAFDIKKDDFNGIDLVASDDIWLENASDIPKNRIVPSKRIGIESAGTEVANKLYRFYELSNENVSVRDKPSEQSLLS